MDTTDQRIPTHHPRIAARVFSGEAVIITPAENMVRMLNAVGSRVWELVDGTRTVEQIAHALTQEFDVDLPQARTSATAFIDELVAKGLLAFVD